MDGFKSGGIKLISDEEINLVTAEHSFYTLHWKKIKRQCRDMADAISEGADMKFKEFVEAAELETDEEAGADLNLLL